MSPKPLIKLFLRAFLPGTTLLLIGIYRYGRAEYERDLTRLKSQETLNVSLGAGELSRNIDDITRDLRLLVDDRALREAVDAPTLQHLNQLTEHFASFSRNKGVYDKVRWIDESGKEVVRVDLVKGQAIVDSAKQLQHKGQRYFFTDAIKLNPGEIYVSPLDLNIEHGQIEIPYYPTVRVATPVVDGQGAKRGIVILNYHARIMLDSFANVTAGIADHVMVVNGDGYWLKSPKANDQWGFMFNRTDLSLAAKAPAAWAKIRSLDSGQIVLADGLWTWKSIYPLLAGEKSSTGANEAFAPSRGNVGPKQYVWKSVAHLPSETLSALQQAIWLNLMMVAALVLTLLGIVSWMMARAWSALTLSEESQRESREQLEAINLAVGNGIISVDERQRIVHFSAAAERMFGYSSVSVIGQPLAMLLPERFRKHHEQHIHDFHASGQSDRTMGTYGLVYGLRESSEEFPVEATVSQSGISPNKRFTVILRDITERRRAEQVREQLTLQLEQLSAQLATGQEEERRNIAYELHEELGQELATLKLYLQMTGSNSEGQQTTTPRAEALVLAAQATERIRKMVLDLEPRELEEFGLEAAVRIFCQTQAAISGWAIQVDAPNPEMRAPRSVERACFRLVQDALNNIVEYAEATKVWIRLRREANELELVIRNNGISFDRYAGQGEDEQSNTSLALLALKIRAQQAGGDVEIKSAPGDETVFRAVFPLPVDSGEPD